MTSSLANIFPYFHQVLFLMMVLVTEIIQADLQQQQQPFPVLCWTHSTNHEIAKRVRHLQEQLKNTMMRSSQCGKQHPIHHTPITPTKADSDATLASVLVMFRLNGLSIESLQKNDTSFHFLQRIFQSNATMSWYEPRLHKNALDQGLELMMMNYYNTSHPSANFGDEANKNHHTQHIHGPLGQQTLIVKANGRQQALSIIATSLPSSAAVQNGGSMGSDNATAPVIFDVDLSPSLAEHPAVFQDQYYDNADEDMQVLDEAFSAAYPNAVFLLVGKPGKQAPYSFSAYNVDWYDGEEDADHYHSIQRRHAKKERKKHILLDGSCVDIVGDDVSITTNEGLTTQLPTQRRPAERGESCDTGTAVAQNETAAVPITTGATFRLVSAAHAPFQDIAFSFQFASDETSWKLDNFTLSYKMLSSSDNVNNNDEQTVTKIMKSTGVPISGLIGQAFRQEDVVTFESQDKAVSVEFAALQASPSNAIRIIPGTDDGPYFSIPVLMSLLATSLVLVPAIWAMGFIMNIEPMDKLHNPKGYVRTTQSQAD